VTSTGRDWQSLTRAHLLSAVPSCRRDGRSALSTRPEGGGAHLLPSVERDG
jgi:hypothetical protein